MKNGNENTIQRGESMRVDITTSGDFKNTISWLNETKNKVPTSTLNSIGREGVNALKAATPKGETGKTAAGWSYRITKNRSGAELAFINNSHPETQANVARLIQLGHGTGTGGYVPPIDYINPALRSQFNSAGDRIAKEMFR